MQIQVDVDATYEELLVIIKTAAMNDTVEELLQRLSKPEEIVLFGIHHHQVHAIEEKDIIRIYAENGHVYTETLQGRYLLKQRLYELEDILHKQIFVRISNAEIINIKMVIHFDLSLSGTIQATLINNTVTFVSRRNVSKIKRTLGMR